VNVEKEDFVVATETLNPEFGNKMNEISK